MSTTQHSLCNLVARAVRASIADDARLSGVGTQVRADDGALVLPDLTVDAQMGPQAMPGAAVYDVPVSVTLRTHMIDTTATEQEVYWGAVVDWIQQVDPCTAAQTKATADGVNVRFHGVRPDADTNDDEDEDVRVRTLSFTLVCEREEDAAPDAVTTPSPSNGATSVALSGTTLTWAASTFASSYDVYFGTTNPPSLVSSGQTNLWYNPGTLSGSTTYYWRIDPKNSVGTTTGTVWSFASASTVTLPDEAVTYSPADAATLVSVNAILEWHPAANATGYDVYFGTVNPPPLVSTNQAGTSYTPASAMLDGAVRYWRVDSRSGAGTTTGTVVSFTPVTPITDGLNCVIAIDYLSDMLDAGGSEADDGEDVAQWSDRSGSNNHVVFGVGARPPKVLAWADGGNRKALDFDGASDVGSTAGTVSVVTYLVVYNWEGAATFPGYCALVGNTNASYGVKGESGSTLMQYNGGFAVVNDIDRTRTMAMIPKSSAGIAYVTEQPHAAARIYIGQRVTTAGTFWNGKIAAVYCYSGALTYAQYELVTDWIAAAYGITLTAF